MADDAVLMVREMVGNAFLHARSGARLSASSTSGVLHVEVGDDSPVPPQLRPASLVTTGGRGVLILDALAADWGVRGALPGKVVWFDVP